ncbi:hypothetical protein CEXT_481561 [Caerostris extrusa]|uniref:Uncharacterized protein n=1 Tax=Caerostris extrusa TaxID=172846 RepID=A0AAV4Y9H8_CAEEX|nr:hypothetical protein CEXT_481561 [Caerostris extrusa]
MLKSSKVNNSQNSELCIRDVNESDSFKTTTAIFEENIHKCNKSYEDCFDADTSQLHSNSSVFIAKNSSCNMNKLSSTNQSFDLSHTPGASFNTDYSYEQHMDYKFMPSNELENNTYNALLWKKTERHKHFQNVEVKTKSELNTKSSCYSEPNYQNSFVSNTLNSSNGAINEAEISDKKWLLYWGRNHNFIVRTWQKDFDPFEEIKNNNHVYDAKISTTQEDGEILNSHIMPQ